MRTTLILLLFVFVMSSKAFGQTTFWHEFSDFEGANISNLLSTTVSGDLYIKPNEDDLYILNENNNWLKISNNLSNISISDVLELSDGSLFVSSNLSGVYKYENNEFVPKINGMDNTRVTSLFDDNGTLYAGTWFDGGLYRSNNNAESWELLGLENTDIIDFVKYNNTYFTSITGRGIRESSDLENWSTSWLGQGDVYELDFLNDGTFIAISSTGILKYENESWQALHPSVSQRNITNLIQTDNGTIIFLQSDGKVFRTFDNFENIQEIPLIDNDARIFFIEVDHNNQLIAGTSNGCYYSNGKIDQNNIFVNYYFESDSIVDFANPITINLNLTDDFGNPLNNHQFSYSDSRYPNEVFESQTNSAGFASLMLEADYYETDGEYTITLMDNDDADFRFSKTYEIKYQVEIKSTPELEIDLVKLFSEPAVQGQTIEFEINSKYYFSNEFKTASNVNLNITNSLTNESIDIETDQEGYYKYTFNIPEEAENGEYTISITSTDETFLMSSEFTDTFLIDNNVSVRMNAVEISFIQTNDYITINSDKIIKNVRLFDLTGRLIDEKYINSFNGEVPIYNLSGFYICLIETGSGYMTKKIIIE